MRKQLDYSKVPDHIWQKHWDELMDSMNQIEVDLRRHMLLVRMIEHAISKQASELS